MGSKTGLSERECLQIGFRKRRQCPNWITAKINMERFHLGTVGSSTAGSLEAQLRAGKSTCTGMPLSDLTESEMTQLQKSGCQLHFGSPGQPVAMIQFTGSPAVAGGLEGDMSDDTVVDSDVISVQILMSKYLSLNSSHMHFVAIPHLMGPTLCGGTII